MDGSSAVSRTTGRPAEVLRERVDDQRGPKGLLLEDISGILNICAEKRFLGPYGRDDESLLAARNRPRVSFHVSLAKFSEVTFGLKPRNARDRARRGASVKRRPVKFATNPSVLDYLRMPVGKEKPRLCGT
jgi:hypothetical protein